MKVGDVIEVRVLSISELEENGKTRPLAELRMADITPRKALPSLETLKRGQTFLARHQHPLNTKGYSSTHLAMGFANVRAGTRVLMLVLV